MDYLLTAASVCFFCLNGAMTRLFQLKMKGGKKALRLYQAGFCLVASVLNLAFFGINALPGTKTVILSLFFGILFAAASFLGAECYEKGPMSLTSVILNLSLAVPLVYSFIVFGESISTTGIAGLALLCVTFVLSALSASGGQKKINTAWIVMVALAFVANGTTAVLQKADAASGSSDGFFLGFAYFVGALCFLASWAVEKGREKSGKCAADAAAFVLPKGDALAKYLMAAIIITVVSGGGSFVGNMVLGKLSVRMDAAVLYPCVNGGLAVLTSVVSAVFFKEKMSLIKIISVAVGAAAIVLLAI